MRWATVTIAVGIDLGTSGCRAIAVGAQGEVLAYGDHPFPEPKTQACSPEVWWQAVAAVIAHLGDCLSLASVSSIAVDGTSGTLLLTDAAGHPVSEVMLYDDSRARDEAARIAAVAPQDSPARGATSALAKLLYLTARCADAPSRALHQADWILGRLCGRFDTSDENNALKLGYDIVARRWPAWLEGLGIDGRLLPRVLAPGTVVGPIDAACARALGLPPTTRIVSGTTDGVAAFLATGAARTGEAVTSLGSTIVLKVLGDRPVFVPKYGVYSHRLGDRWLVGGASNSGGAVLKNYFSDRAIAEMTPRLRPAEPTGLHYYPLHEAGERFPISDPELAPRVTPRPTDELTFFQGLLEGMAEIEARGYRLLANHGAPYPERVITVGGGACNAAWQAMRAARLGVPVETAEHEQAAYGTALLAREGGRSNDGH
jgi:sugar (pentulose or hexulose) kinase